MARLSLAGIHRMARMVVGFPMSVIHLWSALCEKSSTLLIVHDDVLHSFDREAS
jgi:hypothetical protein